MKLKNHLMFVLVCLFLGSSCAKKVETTPAKVKLSLSKIVNFSSGIGSGGAIIFGKSATGEQFGKVVSTNEITLDIPNGDWSFYSVMWNRVSSNMSDEVFCGKSSSKLAGVATTISMSLSNANCADEIFSGNDHYSVAASGALKNRFAQFYTEECDDLSKSSFTCLLSNQGSALSYRFVFKSYKRMGSSTPLFSSEAIYGECVTASSLHQNGLKINFPTGSLGMAFVGSVEMFLGSSDCGNTIAESKGVYTHVFSNGLGIQSTDSKIVNNHGYNCSAKAQTKDVCLELLGAWPSSSCNFSAASNIVSNFASGADCVSAAAAPAATTPRYLKQMVSIPKSFLCRFNDYMNTGVASFPGGDGSGIRPYKICNEWQMNQIGESGDTNVDYANASHFKLMNDLDMNRASSVVGASVFPSPTCAGNSTYGVEAYQNLNPLDGHLCSNTCDVGFIGNFNGDGRTIYNGRMNMEGACSAQMGFVRLLGKRSNIGDSGVIRNVNFKNLSVRGNNYIGGIAGWVNGSAEITNVTITGADIEGDVDVGGAVGRTDGSAALFSKVKVMDSEIRGIDFVGGFIGSNSVMIKQSMFSGIIHGNESIGGTTYAGGFAGSNGGTIAESFSEGYIGTRNTYIGGFVGTNSGTISSVYSTMAISSLENGPGSVYLAGIAAANQAGGAITDCLSDTRQIYYGGATVSYTGTNFDNSGTTTKCYTDSNNVSSHQSATYAQLRDVSYVTANILSGGSAFITPSKWQTAGANGELLRLAWEQRECLLSSNLQTVAAQVSTFGRGSQSNPVLVCTLDQLKELNSRSASEHYRLATDINLSGMGIVSNTLDSVTIFNGQFNGGGHALYGLFLNIDNTLDGEAIFKNISLNAKISHLNLFANDLYTSADTVMSAGILASINNGEISNVKSFSSNLVLDSYAGVLAAKNFGTIKDVEVNEARLILTSYSGGVAGENQGLIQRAASQVNMGATATSSYHSFGAIAGNNSGTIDQTLARGQMNLTDISLAPTHKVGALVGYNAGAISNSYVDEYFRMNIAGTSGIGGAVGVMDGAGATLTTSFSLGQMHFTQAVGDLTTALDSLDDASDTRVIGPLIGKLLNGASVSNSYYLSNLLLIGNGSGVIDYCTSDINLLSGTPPSTNGAFYQHNLLGPVSYTFVSSVVITPDPSYTSCVASDSLNFYTTYKNYAEHGTEKSIADFLVPATFSGFSLEVGDTPAVMNYYLSQMNGTATPAGTPIWNLEDGEDYPRLLQVNH